MIAVGCCMVRSWYPWKLCGSETDSLQLPGCSERQFTRVTRMHCSYHSLASRHVVLSYWPVIWRPNLPQVNCLRPARQVLPVSPHRVRVAKWEIVMRYQGAATCLPDRHYETKECDRGFIDMLSSHVLDAMFSVTASGQYQFTLGAGVTTIDWLWDWRKHEQEYVGGYKRFESIQVIGLAIQMLHDENKMAIKFVVVV